MKLQEKIEKYLNENALDRAKIEKKCKPFLTEFGKNYFQKYIYIYRGYNANINTFQLMKTRTDRRPLLVSQELHKIMDEYTQKYWGWKGRSQAVFTGSSNLTREYGTNYIFLPIGKYQYRYLENPTDIIYGLYDKLSYEQSEFGKDEIEDMKNDIKQIIKEDYKDKGLNAFLNSYREYEALFKCDEYYLINYNYFISHLGTENDQIY